MEIGGGDEEVCVGGEVRRDDSFVPTKQRPNPNPRFVFKRYWKSLVGWSVIVFVLVLVATLTPLFILRDDAAKEDQYKAKDEILKAESGIQNAIRLAFIPAASLSLWVMREPNVRDIHYIDELGVRVTEDYYDGNSPFQEASRRALALVTPHQIEDSVIRNVALAPHSTVSAVFPLRFNRLRGLGVNLLAYPGNRRRHMLSAMLSSEFTVSGPIQTISGGLGLVARFPIFYEATNCSCSASSPTSNDVMVRTGPLPKSPEELNNISLSSRYTFAKLDDPLIAGEDGRRLPRAVVYDAPKMPGERPGLKTMFCDPAPQMGLEGLKLEDYGIEGGFDLSTTFLPKCRFFWGTANVFFDFVKLMEHLGHLERLESLGFSYSLMKTKGLGNEEVFLFVSFLFHFYFIFSCFSFFFHVLLLTFSPSLFPSKIHLIIPKNMPNLSVPSSRSQAKLGPFR